MSDQFAKADRDLVCLLRRGNPALLLASGVLFGLPGGNCGDYRGNSAAGKTLTSHGLIDLPAAYEPMERGFL